ncbi:hypothetical protein [Halomicrococcus sp. NG-SE-24]|uniref:hypothetical protein n=1 Tax=Halomicrococcus sp. NG-SE-24 TaxID=3436928 RepID=UPI003D97D916
MSVLFAGILALLWERTTRESGLPAFVVGGTVFAIWQFVLGEPALFGEGTMESAVPATAAALLTIVGISIVGNGEPITVERLQDDQRSDPPDTTPADD